MLPLEAYQYQIGVKSQSNMKSPVTRFISSSYKSNPFLKHQLFRQACYQPKHLYSKDLNITKEITSFGFSKNGDFFVGAVFCGPMVLWHTTQFLGVSYKPRALTLDVEHRHNMVYELTTSPDDHKILSSIYLKIQIHDVHTGQLLGYLATNSRNRPAHYASLNGLSVQPGNKQGDIIATAGGDGTLRIFDVRFCNTIPVITAPQRPVSLNSVSFSPIDESLVAVAGNEIGTELIDIRNPHMPMRSFPSPYGSCGLHFNCQGTRLLCLETGLSAPTLYDLKSEKNTPNMCLTNPGYNIPCSSFSEMTACFAGRDGEAFSDE